MGISLRKYTERSAKNKRSYQLRTGQMKQSVRKIEPVQYVDSKKSVYPELPRYPIVGECYMYDGMNVFCVEAIKGNEALRCDTCELACNRKDCIATNCGAIDRIDKKYIYLKKHNA